MLKKLLNCLTCFFNKHKLLEVKRLSESSQKLYCFACKKYFAINHSVRIFLPWDNSFEELYKMLERMHE